MKKNLFFLYQIGKATCFSSSSSFVFLEDFFEIHYSSSSSTSISFESEYKQTKKGCLTLHILKHQIIPSLI